MGKFNVGDRVVLTHDNNGYGDKGNLGTIVSVGSFDAFVHFDRLISGDHKWYASLAILRLADQIQKPAAIVCLIENGQPKPAERPHVHATEAAASIEAKRLAGVHKGKQFGVYVLSDTHEQPKPVYAHQWQRLAANGEKISAIKELRSITGMQLKPAKDVVEGFIDSPYGAIAA